MWLFIILLNSIQTKLGILIESNSNTIGFKFNLHAKSFNIFIWLELNKPTINPGPCNWQDESTDIWPIQCKKTWLGRRVLQYQHQYTYHCHTWYMCPKNGLNFKQLKNSRKSFKPRQDCIGFQLSGIDGAFTRGRCKHDFYDKLQ